MAALMVFGAVCYLQKAGTIWEVQGDRQSTRTYAMLSRVQLAVEYYYGFFPTNEQHVGEIVRMYIPMDRSGAYWRKAFDEQGRLLDGWGRPFVVTVESNGTVLVVKSLGRNGLDDGGKGDDMVLVETLPGWEPGEDPKAIRTQAMLRRAELTLEHLPQNAPVPTNEHQLVEIVRKYFPIAVHTLNWRTSLEKQRRLLDGWSRPFVVTVESNGTVLAVKSLGRNGLDDGGKSDDQVYIKALDVQ